MLAQPIHGWRTPMTHLVVSVSRYRDGRLCGVYVLARKYVGMGKRKSYCLGKVPNGYVVYGKLLANNLRAAERRLGSLELAVKYIRRRWMRYLYWHWMRPTTWRTYVNSLFHAIGNNYTALRTFITTPQTHFRLSTKVPFKTGYVSAWRKYILPVITTEIWYELKQMHETCFSL